LKTQLYKSISNYFHNYTNNKTEAFTFSLQKRWIEVWTSRLWHHANLICGYEQNLRC